MKKIVSILVIIVSLGISAFVIYSSYGKNTESEVFVFKRNNKAKESFSFSSSIDILDTYYLAIDGKKKLNFRFSDDVSRNITLFSSDTSVVRVEGDTFYGVSVGNATITAKSEDVEKSYNVVVTDLITAPVLKKNKAYLPCKRYTSEENILLDKILESRVKEMGERTRGGVLAAARFITLEFPYTIGYFNENGRLNGHGYRPYIDGEGRYYHKGLYLSEEKYKDIIKSTKTGPKMWGCKLYDNFVDRYKANGFTCSGFVTWAMYNGGFATEDVGAGDYKQFDDDLSDLGPHQKITYEYMKNGNYKVGDFIARNGHAALIVGIDDKTIYTAESLPPKLKIYTYERYSGIVNDPNLTYVIEMSDIYPNGDGITTDMWE